MLPDGILYSLDKTCLLSCPADSRSAAIAHSVRIIGKGAFSGCRSLTSLTIPDSVISIEPYAFSGCTGITDLIIPASVKTVGNNAFLFCIRLASLTLSGCVADIGDNAFAGCGALRAIRILNEKPLSCTPGFEETVLKDAILCVPCGSLEAYKRVAPWKNFANIAETDFHATPEKG